MGGSVYNTCPRDTAGATKRNYTTKSLQYKKEPITNLKNRTKNYRKNYIANSNPTHGQKKDNAGHIKTGQTKFLIPLRNFL